MMERDEILLNVLADSDEEEEFDSVPHRTLDEILNDSYSSSSSPSSPPSNHNRQSHLLDFSQDLSESLKVVQSLIVDDDKSDHQSTVSNQEKVRSSSGLLTSRASSSSRPLPSLFTGVRSNGKPGAALAAAVAASRSVPTPHAAAIKSRRRLLDTRDSDSNDVEYEAVSNGNSNSNSIVFGTASAENEAHMDDSSLTRDGNSDSLLTTVVEPVLSTEDSRFSNDDHQEASDSAVTSTTIDCENRQDASETDTHSSPGVDEDVLIKKDYENEGNMTMVPSEEVDGLEEVHTPGDTVGSQEESGSVSDISELVEERIGQLENERMSKIAEKKLRPPLKPLELAEELEKKQAFTGLHWEEGAAAQPMRLEGVRRGSTTLGYFYIDADNVVTGAIASQQLRRDYGSAHVLAVHLNYIAVGTAKGVIVVFPSRYSTHSPDVTDAKMLILGLQGDRSLSPVTSMCFNQQGDLLLAGYDDGHVTVWDMQKAAAAKVITGEHNAPVVHTMFLGQEYQASRQFKAVTGDSKGLVLLHAFSVVPLINRFSIKTQCLLDGQKTGTVLTASPLLFDESCGNVLPSPVGNTSVASSSIGSMMGGVVGADAGWKLFNEGSSLVEEGVVIFATYQTALVVKLTPNLEVYAQISKPEGVREGSMPYTAWKCTTQSKSSSTDASERVSLLAIAWDRKVEVAKLIKSELKVYGKWSIDSAAVGVAWLDTHLLVVLTVAGQLYLFGKDGTPIHQTSFSIHVSGGDNLLAYHTHFLNIYGNPEKAYHNSIAVRGASIYILGPMHLIVCRLLPWKERIQVLRSAGDWMGALNMAMTLYDGQAHGVIDLPRSVDAVRESIMPYLLELLLSYVDEVFSYISVAFCNQREKVEHKEDLKSGGSSVHVEIKEQFTRVGGVAVEFCVHIQRTDILFDEIFSKFIAVQQKDTFLELLEPYILRDMLGTLPPEIMQALVEHYSSKGWLHRVEQCVLHMDISSLDFNQVVRLCREHALYGALIYLFNKGLDDFKTPLEELLVVLQKTHTENASVLGYRILVYLKYCFSGLAFPPGHGTLPSTRVSSLRAELVQFLLENSNSQTLQAAQCKQSRGTYLNLYHLLELDTEATLDVLKCAFEDDKTQNPDFSLHDSTSSNLESKQEYMMSASQNILVQNTVDALVHIIERYVIQADESASTGDAESGEVWPTRKDVGHVFEFIGCYVACRNAYVSKNVLNQILEYLTSGSNLPTSTHVQVVGTSKSREKQVLALIQVVPVADWNASYVLQLCERAGFHQVCGFIHSIRHQYLPALESYMKDVDEPIHAFSYINDLLEQLSGNQYEAFRRALVSMIPELVVLSREGTFFLVMDHFNSETDHVLSELRSHPKSLFLYLKTVIEVHLSGTLDFHNLRRDSSADVYNGRIGEDQNKRLETYLEKITKFSKLVRNNVVNVTDDMIELYLELLCQYEPNSVLRFLETFDSYRVEHCLRLCQEYGIIDAAAFLLERVGDVGSALLFRISGLDDKFAELDKAVGNIASGKALSSSTSIKCYHTLSNMKEVNDIRSILQACIGLCQRNTLRLMPEESEALWFKLLDSFCEPLMESYDNKGAYEVNNGFGVLIENQSTRNDDVVCVIKWKISKSHKGARVLRKLFSQFIKEIVEGMIGYVRLPTIMSKLLSDDGNQELGDFKITILGMLGTYGFERRILDTAKSVIEDDTFYAMSLLKKGASHGYAPRGLACCICSCLLSKGSSTFSVRVFSCGHATHLQCELLENESPSRGSLSGCPICMPKKNAERAKNKSALPDDGLIDQVSTRPPRAQGPYLLHPHEDLIENSYGLQHISRFEMLSNLQREQRFMQMEIMPQLKLAPPAVYQERAQKGPIISAGESSSLPLSQKPTKQLSELKVKGSSSLRFPLKSNIFGKEKQNRY